MWSQLGCWFPVRVKDSRTAALQMGQAWKRAPQLSHTQACRQGSSTTLTAALRHTTQSLQPPSELPSSSSCLVLGAAVAASSVGDALLCSASADMKRDWRTQTMETQRPGQDRTDHRSPEEGRKDQILSSGALEQPGAACLASRMSSCSCPKLVQAVSFVNHISVSPDL